jgi:hypothetical protein
MGTTIGTVENLVVDKAARKVRYLEVNVDRTFHNNYGDSGYYLDKDTYRANAIEDDIHFLIPIGLVSLDHSDKTVEIDGISADSLGATPRYRRGSAIGPHYEIHTLNHYADNHSSYGTSYDRSRYRDFDGNMYGGMDDQFYTSGFFNDSRFYDRHTEATTSKGL